MSSFSGSSQTNNQEEIGKLSYEEILAHLAKLQVQHSHQHPLTKELKYKVDQLFKRAIKLTAVSNVNTNNDKLGSASILYFAAYFGDTDTINYLLKNYLKKLQQQPSQLCLAIDNAATYRHDEVLKLLLSEPDIVNTMTNDYFEYLYRVIQDAARKEHLNTLRLFLNTPAIVNAIIEKFSDKLGYLIQDAAENGHTKVLNLLLDKPIIRQALIAKSYGQLGLAIIYLAEKGHTVALNRLLDKTDILEVVIKKYPLGLGYAIQNAAENGHIGALNRLLEKTGVLETVINKCSEKLVYSIYTAAINRRYQSLQLLLTTISRSEVTTQTDTIINKTLNAIGNKHDTNSDIYKIVALYVDVITKNKNNITIKRLEEIIQLAYEYNLYTILLVIKDEFKPTPKLIKEAIAAAKQAVKPTQNSAIIQNICKDILLQVEGQWKADNRMTYGNLIEFITSDKFDPYNPATRLQLDQIKQENNSKLENKLSVRKFLSAI